MSPSEEPPEFLTDRNLGAYKVPGLLRAAGLTVVTLQERYGVERAARIADVEWLRDAGEAGQVVLVRDTRIRRNPLERQALVDAAVRAFCLARGHATGDEQAAMFLRHFPRILDASRGPGPSCT